MNEVDECYYEIIIDVVIGDVIEDFGDVYFVICGEIDYVEYLFVDVIVENVGD